jgi:hypothetical protein
MPSPAPKPKRRRGAPLGNHNARKSTYQATFTPEEFAKFGQEANDEFIDELTLTRVQIGRLAELAKGYKEMPLQDYIFISNTLDHYLDRYERLTRGRQVIFRKQTTMEQALAELAAIPPEED